MLQAARKPRISIKRAALQFLLALTPAALAVSLMLVTKTNAAVLSYIYNTASRLSYAISQAASVIPFAVAPWLAAVLLVWFVVGFVVAIAKTAALSDLRFLVRSIKNRVFTASILYLAFVILFGVSYNAPKLSVAAFASVRSSVITARRTTLSESCENWIRLANFLRPIVPSSEAGEVLNAVPTAFANTAGISDTPYSPKPSGIDALLGGMMIEGIYVPFTGEALVNTSIPLIDLPFVACHEAAHSIGYAREDEANLVSMIVCGSSQNPLFRYSGAMAAVRYSLARILRTDMFEYNRLVSLMSPAVSRDLGSRNAYWSAKRNSSAAVFANRVNDLFLSYAGMQENGAMSYEGVLDLTD
ncbi:MAG: DUF3810 domain-containing protein [Oscillospiraceae bacterium]|jgi:hypothetical protein|nr:DUF3810 domain-containing protein [Oscillospiraceae bacterium]